MTDALAARIVEFFREHAKHAIGCRIDAPCTCGLDDLRRELREQPVTTACRARCKTGAWSGNVCELPKHHAGQHRVTCAFGPRIGEQLWWGNDREKDRATSSTQRQDSNG